MERASSVTNVCLVGQCSSVFTDCGKEGFFVLDDVPIFEVLGNTGIVLNWLAKVFHSKNSNNESLRMLLCLDLP